MNERTYLLCFLVAVLVLAAAVVSINYLVDPYGITGAKRVAGFNEFKVDINNHSRLLKKYQHASGDYDTLIVGNSRVEMGLDPSHHCFKLLGWSVYNMGVPGAGVRKQLRYALNAIYQQPIERVFLSVDFSDFIRRPENLTQPASSLHEVDDGEFKFLPAGQESHTYTGQMIRDYSKSLFSLDALTSSFLTLAGQSKNSPDRDIKGFNPARDFAHVTAVEGPAALFQQKLGELTKRYQGRHVLTYADGSPHSSFADIRAFVQIANEQGIQVTLHTNPFHTAYWQLLQSADMAGLHEEWLTLLTGLLQTQPLNNFSLWDFSRDSAYIHEPVPGAGDLVPPLQWFWEPAHYRSSLGNLMLDAMLAEQCGSEASFGEKML